MSPDRNDEGRPAGNGPASNVINGDNTEDSATETVTRCTRCGHPLTAPKSVDLEIGPKCRLWLAREVVA